MAANMLTKGSGSEAFSIPDLVRLTSAGAIRIPKFQRSFVWDANDVRSLFDSLFRGFPVGTILLWRQDAPAGKVQIGPIVLDVEARREALWVVDGQQRITSLVGALSSNLKNVDERFQVYFDLENKRFIGPRHGIIAGPRSIPVREALETKTLLNWLRQHSDVLENEDYDLADALGGALRDYRIPAYVVTGDNQGLLREVFDRVNSSGKPISRAQVFHALFAAETEPGSPGSVVEALRKQGFGLLDENRIVQSLLAIRGGDVQRDIHGEFGAGEDPAEWYDKTEQALTAAIEFLRSIGVKHLLLLPNTLPLPVLAAFFFVHPDPAPWTRRLLARWVWRGWVHGFGRDGGQTPILRRAVSSINPKGRISEEKSDEFEAVASLLKYVPDHPAPILPLREFSTNRANSRLMLLAMLTLHPLGPDGKEIDVAGQLERRGVEAVTQIVRGSRKYVATRAVWPVEAEPLKYVTDHRILESHAVDPLAAEHLWKNEIDLFIERREKILQELIFSFLDSRIEQNSLVRPPIEDLIVKGLSEEEGLDG